MRVNTAAQALVWSGRNDYSHSNVELYTWKELISLRCL
jgi:hypothetical protein